MNEELVETIEDMKAWIRSDMDTCARVGYNIKGWQRSLMIIDEFMMNLKNMEKQENERQKQGVPRVW
jgi:hypothetical protein